MFSPRRFCDCILASVLVLTVAVASTSAKPPPKHNQPANSKRQSRPHVSLAVQFQEAQVLRSAYVALGTANYDYNGHKAAAMRTIEATIHALDHNIMSGGNVKLKVATKQARAAAAQAHAAGVLAGGVHEGQGNSDAQLRLSLEYLVKVRAAAANHRQPWILKQAHAASKDIRRALATR